MTDRGQEYERLAGLLRTYDIRLWRDADGWHYDGPASCGPRHVRRSGRGPYWRGPVSPQFAGALLHRVRELAA